MLLNVVDVMKNVLEISLDIVKNAILNYVKNV